MCVFPRKGVIYRGLHMYRDRFQRLRSPSPHPPYTGWSGRMGEAAGNLMDTVYVWGPHRQFKLIAITNETNERNVMNTPIKGGRYGLVGRLCFFDVQCGPEKLKLLA